MAVGRTLGALGSLNQFLGQQISELKEDEKDARLNAALSNISQSFRELGPDASEEDVRSLTYKLINRSAQLGVGQETLQTIGALRGQEVEDIRYDKTQAQDLALSTEVAREMSRPGLAGKFGADEMLKFAEFQAPQTQVVTGETKAGQISYSIASIHKPTGFPTMGDPFFITGQTTAQRTAAQRTQAEYESELKIGAYREKRKEDIEFEKAKARFKPLTTGEKKYRDKQLAGVIIGQEKSMNSILNYSNSKGFVRISEDMYKRSAENLSKFVKNFFNRGGKYWDIENKLTNEINSWADQATKGPLSDDDETEYASARRELSDLRGLKDDVLSAERRKEFLISQRDEGFNASVNQDQSDKHQTVLHKKTAPPAQPKEASKEMIATVERAGYDISIFGSELGENFATPPTFPGNEDKNLSQSHWNTLPIGQRIQMWALFREYEGLN